MAARRRRGKTPRHRDPAATYGGAWSGDEFVLTHRPDELADDPLFTALDVEAVHRAREVAGGKDMQIISADIALPALEHDLLDELAGRLVRPQRAVAPEPV